MPPILFVRCDASETFGVAPAAVAAAGGTVRAWNALDPADPRPPLDDVGGVVVFGSTFNVEHADEQPFIEETADLIREALDRRIPFLGVCFGGQLLAWALDAAVGEGPIREIGFEPIRPTEAAAHDSLFSHVADGDMGFQWHMDAFDLPEGATLLASGDQIPNQAFRVGDLAWGTQFHCEVNRAELEFWLDEFAKVGDLRTDWGKSSRQVREEADRHMADHERRGHEVFERFALLATGS
ncbi:MAG TPA: type 1 glutamine amidotransferase [Actinomycetota bacterium]|nr:type 1 glutamine amidotransferase [Actinomycetota bacterium]